MKGEATRESKYGAVPVNFAMDDVKCSGTEDSLLNCTALWFKDDCGKTEGAGVICT